MKTPGMRNTVPKSIVRIALATVFILVLPWLAMHFTDEVTWSVTDFAVAGILLSGTGLMYVLATKHVQRAKHRATIVVVFLAGLFLVWAELAVGIFD